MNQKPQMEQSSWLYHSTILSSFFSFKARSNGDVFSHWTEVNLLLPCPPPCWYVCRLPLSIVLFYGRLSNWMLAQSCSWWKGPYYGSACQNHISLPTGKWQQIIRKWVSPWRKYWDVAPVYKVGIAWVSWYTADAWLVCGLGTIFCFDLTSGVNLERTLWS